MSAIADFLASLARLLRCHEPAGAVLDRILLKLERLETMSQTNQERIDAANAA